MRSVERVKVFITDIQMLNLDLDRVEREHEVDLGRSLGQMREVDEDYYPQIEEAYRREAARMAPHYETFYSLERTIRRLVSDTLAADDEASEASHGDWWQVKVPDKIRGDVEKRQKKEINSAVTRRSNSPIDFCTFGELSEIITSNWDVFSGMFTSKEAVQRVMANLNGLRGPIAHCAPLAEDEVLRLTLSVRDWFRLMD
ncbi:Swt1 family HEPN domain-containing protein [Janibacter melonis]|uniref:Swt1 family HEPN domain-containing protein n=1 Tax=Janibacter melonis TaxID=262209 RepID=UPI00191B64B8|nr:Swt1 family HEPN domain-containing protein [Janibacter melonis]